MTTLLKDRILEFSTSSGVGPFLLGGALSKFRSFSTFGTDSFYYTIEDSLDIYTGSDWEIGEGTYVGGVLNRTRVIASSNADALVDFPSGVTWLVHNSIPEEFFTTVAVGPANTFRVNSEASMLALGIKQGDVCVRTDINESFKNLLGANAAISDWEQIGVPLLDMGLLV